MVPKNCTSRRCHIKTIVSILTESGKMYVKNVAKKREVGQLNFKHELDVVSGITLRWLLYEEGLVCSTRYSRPVWQKLHQEYAGSWAVTLINDVPFGAARISVHPVLRIDQKCVSRFSRKKEARTIRACCFRCCYGLCRCRVYNFCN